MIHPWTSKGNAKLKQAFREAEAQTGQKVSLIGMDACLMSMSDGEKLLHGLLHA